jgi:hypothetical protein
MELNPDKILVRQAIWEVYYRRCYYSDVSIKIHELQLDHVIPLHLLKKPKELQKTLKQFKLPADFRVKSILNVVPCLPKENSRKGKDILPNTTLILNDIKRKLKNVETRYIQLLKEDNEAKSLSLYKKAIKTSNTKPEELHDFLMDTKPVYDELESYLNDFHYAHYSCSTKRVFLNGILPKPSTEVASCCVNFKSLELRDLMFTINEHDVFELAKPEHKKRTLEIQPNPKHDPELAGTAFFIFNGVNFFLNIDEIHQFYDLINRYCEKVKIHRKLVHEYYGGENFEYSRPVDGYRLGKINRNLWRLMMKFAKKFDFDKGNSKWHMLDARNNAFMVTTNKTCQKYNSGFHTMLVPEQITDHFYQDFRYPDNDMWIVWRKKEPHVRNGAKSYSVKDKWNASVTFDWLTKEYIPYLVWYYETKKKVKFLRYRYSFDRFKNEFDVSSYIEI